MQYCSVLQMLTFCKGDAKRGTGKSGPRLLRMVAMLPSVQCVLPAAFCLSSNLI